MLVADRFKVAGSLSYSTDGGETWNKCDVSEITPTYPAQLAYSNGRFYVVMHLSDSNSSHNAADSLCYSDDGIVWHIHQKFKDHKNAPTTNKVTGYGVCAVGNTIVVSGAYSKGYCSTDGGETWTTFAWKRYYSDTAYKDSYVAYANGTWGVCTSCGISSEGYLQTSTDGLSWNNSGIFLADVNLRAAAVGDAVVMSGRNLSASTSSKPRIAYKRSGSQSFVDLELDFAAMTVGHTFSMNDGYFYFSADARGFNQSTIYKTQDFVTFTPAYAVPAKVDNAFMVGDGNSVYVVVGSNVLLKTGFDVVYADYVAKNNDGATIGGFTNVVTGSYVGTGNSTNFIILPFRAKYIRIVRTMASSTTTAYRFDCTPEMGNTLFLDGMFVLSGGAVADVCNTEGTTYYYMAFC